MPVLVGFLLAFSCFAAQKRPRVNGAEYFGGT